MIFALPWLVSVTMPACEPVNEIAWRPRSMIAMDSERHGDALARREKHVELAVVRPLRDLPGELQQLVCRVAHRRDDHADLVAGLRRLHDPPRDVPDPLGVADRRTTVLLNDKSHARNLAAPAARSARF